MADVPLGDLLRCAIQVIGRLAIKPELVSEVVATSGRQLKAYNLCDGTRSQGQVAKSAGLDQGNFSRTATRWVESGVLFKIGNGNDAKLLHLYPLVKGTQGRKKSAEKPSRKGVGRPRRAKVRGGR